MPAEIVNDPSDASWLMFEFVSDNVRCGANEGEVVVFEDSNLEKLVDQVIDVAGHMQRSAIPDTLRLSADLYKVLDDSTGFQPTGETVDALATYEWSPQRVSHA